MDTTKRRRPLDELARLGDAIYDQRIRPTLRPEDHGKFVAIDVDTGEYEMDEDDYKAVMGLRARMPAADSWLMRVGYAATCRIGWGRSRYNERVSDRSRVVVE